MKLLPIVLKEDYKSQYKKFVEKEGIDSDTVASYLKTFKKLRDRFPKAFDNEMLHITVPVEKRRDIDAYNTFKELETVVDFIRGQVDVPDDDVSISGDTTVYENDVLRISKGTSPNTCLKIKSEGAAGKSISWCVARKDSSNMYYSYRLNANEPTFYFVLNKKKSNKDKYFFFVVQITKDGQYIVTSSNNDGDIKMTWDQIVKIEPNLVNLKDIFKHEKISSDDRVASGFKDIDAEKYSKLNYKHKKQYIEALYKLDFEMLRITPMDLIEYYINLGKYTLTSKQEEWLESKNQKLYNRYTKLLLRKIGDNKFLKDLMDISIDTDLEPYKTGEKGWINDVKYDNYRGGTITLYVDDMDDVYRAADIDPNGLSHLESYASSYHYRDWDTHELDYMWRTFTPQLEELMIKLLKRVGVKKTELDKLDEEGKLKEILERYSFGKKIMEEYMTEYSNAEERAETAEAEEMLEKYRALPLEFDSRRPPSIDINDINEFVGRIIEIDNTINNFEDAIVKLLETTDLDGDLYYMEYHGNMEYGELETAMENVITNAIEDLDDTYEGEYFNKVNGKLDELGFVADRFENELVTILVDEKLPENMGDDITQEMIDDPSIAVRIIDNKTGKKEEGNVKLSSLPNYMYNYQLFESLKKIKMIMESY